MRRISWLLLLSLLLPGCAPETPKAAPTTTKAPETMNAKKVTLVGQAENAKAGAVLLTDDGLSPYIDGLSSWPDDLKGKRVEVTGFLKKKKMIPDPVTAPDGAVSAGAFGGQSVIEDAAWKLAKSEE